MLVPKKSVFYLKFFGVDDGKVSIRECPGFTYGNFGYHLDKEDKAWVVDIVPLGICVAKGLPGLAALEIARRLEESGVYDDMCSLVRGMVKKASAGFKNLPHKFPQGELDDDVPF